MIFTASSSFFYFMTGLLFFRILKRNRTVIKAKESLMTAGHVEPERTLRKTRAKTFERGITGQ